jgi:hypothetical protein
MCEVGINGHARRHETQRRAFWKGRPGIEPETSCTRTACVNHSTDKALEIAGGSMGLGIRRAGAVGAAGPWARPAVLHAAAPGHHAPHGRLLQRIRGSTSAPTHQLAWHIDLYCPSVEV